MPETLSKMWAYFILVVMMMVGISMYMIRFETTRENEVADQTAKFVNECQTTGYIDPVNYSTFAHKIYAMGNYEIEIEHSAIRCNPTGVAGEYTRDYYSHSTQEILDEMFPGAAYDDVRYDMNEGDILTVTVTKNTSKKLDILEVLTGKKMTGRVSTRYSGMIGHSVKE